MISPVLRQRWARPLLSVLSTTLSSPDPQTKGIVPSLLLSGQPFQSINWTRVRGKFFAAKAAPFRTYESAQMNDSSPTPSLPTSFFSFSRRVEERGVPQRTVWVMREISGRDALEVGTLCKQRSVYLCKCVYVCVGGTEAGSREMKDWRWQMSVAWRLRTW